MPFTLADRVKETTTTTGTGAYALGGAVTGFRAFSAFCANADTTHYCCEDGANWEIGLGTWNTGNTLTRTTILASSNAGAAVNWGAGTKNVFCTAASTQVTAPVVTSINGGQLAGFRNKIINGNMGICQRYGTTAQTVTTGIAAPNYVLDRWYTNTNSYSITAQCYHNLQSRPRLYLTGSASGSTVAYVGQRIEAANCFGLYDNVSSTAKTCSLSVSAYVGSGSGTLNWYVYYPATADTFGNIMSGTVAASGSWSITSSAATYSASFSSVSGMLKGAEIVFTITLGTSQTLFLYDAQFELGSVATPFEFRPFGTELALCQRYYQKNTAYSVAPANGVGYSGSPNTLSYSVATASNFVEGYHRFIVEMRAAPTMVFYKTNLGTTDGYWAFYRAGYVDFSPSYYAGTNGACVYATVSGNTAGYCYATAGVYTASAEL